MTKHTCTSYNSKHTLVFQDLISELKSELSSDFKHTILALVKTPAEYDTEDIRKAVKGKNKEDMMEILCTRSADEIWDIKQEYRKGTSQFGLYSIFSHFDLFHVVIC